jgi:6-phospho-beta-glucosidase
MSQIKSYERLTIQAAVEGSEKKAIQALTLHPLVADQQIATTIVRSFKQAFGESFLSGVK